MLLLTLLEVRPLWRRRTVHTIDKLGFALFRWYALRRRRYVNRVYAHTSAVVKYHYRENSALTRGNEIMRFRVNTSLVYGLYLHTSSLETGDSNGKSRRIGRRRVLQKCPEVIEISRRRDRESRFSRNARGASRRRRRRRDVT